MADVHAYRYEDGTHSCTLTYRRERTILRTHFIEAIHGLKRLAARLIGFDGSTSRFAGTVEVVERDGGVVRDEQRDEGIWELMYFGRHAHESRERGGA